MAGLGVCIKTELLEEGVRGVETGQTGEGRGRGEQDRRLHRG